MALIDDLKSRYPNIPTDLIDSNFVTYEAIYNIYYNAEYGQNKTDDEIILNLLAHLIVSEENTKNGENISVVSGESAGGVSRSYIANAMNQEDKFFNSTIYGQKFLLLTSRKNKIYFV